MRNALPILVLAAVASLAACKKTGENEYEVQKPVIGTQTDTVRTPDVDVNTRRDTITTPTVGTERREVNVPNVDVKRP